MFGLTEKCDDICLVFTYPSNLITNHQRLRHKQSYIDEYIYPTRLNNVF